MLLFDFLGLNVLFYIIYQQNNELCTLHFVEVKFHPPKKLSSCETYIKLTVFYVLVSLRRTLCFVNSTVIFESFMFNVCLFPFSFS